MMVVRPPPRWDNVTWHGCVCIAQSLFESYGERVMASVLRMLSFSLSLFKESITLTVDSHLRFDFVLAARHTGEKRWLSETMMFISSPFHYTNLDSSYWFGWGKRNEPVLGCGTHPVNAQMPSHIQLQNEWLTQLDCIFQSIKRKFHWFRMVCSQRKNHFPIRFLFTFGRFRWETVKRGGWTGTNGGRSCETMRPHPVKIGNKPKSSHCDEQ